MAADSKVQPHRRRTPEMSKLWVHTLCINPVNDILYPNIDSQDICEKHFCNLQRK